MPALSMRSAAPFAGRQPRPAVVFLAFLLLPLSFLGPLSLPARAELITVGPTSSGCSFDNLLGAVVRAAITPEGDTIAISENTSHTSSAALAQGTGGNVTIRGVTSCTDLSPQRRTIVTTRGNLFEYSNVNLTIRDLRLTSGPDGGRLLRASGAMLLTLEDTQIDTGKAISGGNIHVTNGASMVALAGTEISFGTADTNGGGIFCSGPGTVALTQGSIVTDNRAETNGGGIYATGCAVNVLAGGPAPDGGTFGIVNNSAGSDGGGIYGRSGADIRVAGTNGTAAVVGFNFATLFGGGIAIEGQTTVATIWDAEIISNLAFRRGGGLYVADGAELEMDRTLPVCSRGVLCSALSGNTVADTPATTLAGAIAVETGGRAEIRQTFIAGNGDGDNARIARVDGAGSTLLIEGSVLFQNDPRGTKIVASNGGVVQVAYTSAWRNTSDDLPSQFFAADSNGQIAVYASIIIEGDGTALGGGGFDRIFAPAGTGASYIADCVMAHETDSFPGTADTNRVETDAAAVWVNPASGDPHLRPDTVAIDYCDTTVYAPVDRDIDDEVRGIDDPSRPNLLGPFDIGADERSVPPVGLIFADGFESTDTSAWSATVP